MNTTLTLHPHPHHWLHHRHVTLWSTSPVRRQDRCAGHVCEFIKLCRSYQALLWGEIAKKAMSCLEVVGATCWSSARIADNSLDKSEDLTKTVHVCVCDCYWRVFPSCLGSRWKRKERNESRQEMNKEVSDQIAMCWCRIPLPDWLLHPTICVIHSIFTTPPLVFYSSNFVSPVPENKKEEYGGSDVDDERRDIKI